MRFLGLGKGAPSGAPELAPFCPTAEVERHVSEIAATLRTLRVGAILPYGDILRSTNLDLESVRYRIFRACKRVQKEGPYLFITARGEGIQRVPVETVPRVIEGHRSKAFRAAGRGVKAGTEAAPHLKGETKRVVAAQVAGLQTLRSFARKLKPRNKTVPAAISTPPVLPMAASPGDD